MDDDKDEDEDGDEDCLLTCLLRPSPNPVNCRVGNRNSNSRAGVT